MDYSSLERGGLGRGLGRLEGALSGRPGSPGDFGVDGDEFVHVLATSDTATAISGKIGRPLGEGSALDEFEAGVDAVTGAIVGVSTAAGNQGVVEEAELLLGFFDGFLVLGYEGSDFTDDALVEFFVSQRVEFERIGRDIVD